MKKTNRVWNRGNHW